MKYFWMILAMGIVGGGFFYYITENEKAAKAEAYRRELEQQAKEEERLAKQKIEDERIRKERMANLAKEDAVRMLQKYIAKQEEQLKDEIAEYCIELKKIDVDQSSLSDELAALEKEEEAKAKDAERRKISRRDKNERVDALLSSPTLNRLALDYLGEDLSAMRSQYRSHIGNMIKIGEQKKERLAENKKKYRASMDQAGKEFERILGEAKKQREKTDYMIREQIRKKRELVAMLEARVQKLEHKRAKGIALTQWEEKELKETTQSLAVHQAQLATDENTANLSETERLHMQATHELDAATVARDTAVSEKAEADDAVHAEAAFERDIYNLSVVYEKRSLDGIRAAIVQRRALYSDKLGSAKKKLEFLSASSGNMDFLNAEEVEGVRKRIAGKIADDSFWTEE